MRHQRQKELDAERVQDMVVRCGDVGENGRDREIPVVLDRPDLVVFGRVAPDVQDPDRRQEREQNAADQDKKIPAAHILLRTVRGASGARRLPVLCGLGYSRIRRISCLCLVMIHNAAQLRSLSGRGELSLKSCNHIPVSWMHRDDCVSVDKYTIFFLLFQDKRIFHGAKSPDRSARSSASRAAFRSSPPPYPTSALPVPMTR